MHILAIVGTEETEAAVACGLSGARLAYAETGAQGVDLAVREAFDIILLDPRLPDMSGPTVLRRLRDGAVKAPVLIVSDQAGVEDMSRGFGFGADGYVKTPVRGDELVDAIYRAAGRHPNPGSNIEIGGLRIDTALRSVRVDGETRQDPVRQGIPNPRAARPPPRRGRHEAGHARAPLRRDGRARDQDHRRVRLSHAQDLEVGRGAAARLH